MPSVIDSPSGRLPEKAPRLDLMGTEAFADGKVFSWLFLVSREYLGIYRPKNRVRRPAWGAQARGCPPRARPGGLSPPGRSPAFISKSGRFLLVQEKSFRRFYSVWTPFSIPYLQYSKTRKNRNWH